MRVIQEGQPDKTWPREHEVPCCGSVLELEPSDILINRDYTGDFSSYFINCPVCGAQPDIPASVKHDGDRWMRQERNRA